GGDDGIGVKVVFEDEDGDGGATVAAVGGVGVDGDDAVAGMAVVVRRWCSVGDGGRRWWCGVAAEMDGRNPAWIWPEKWWRRRNSEGRG
ncbi:hypothetical protein Tco_1555738, partial [Tanacetum coccineum]